MKTIILDLETTIKQSARRVANPFDIDNYIVCIAYKFLDQDKVYTFDYSSDVFHNVIMNNNVDVIVGQNIKFDLLYLLCAEKDTKWLKSIYLYDTMFAEYLLTGQQSKFCSLNNLSIKYGGTLKDDRVKEYWNAGICTSEIPKDILYEYAKYDILNTELVYLKQQKSIKTLHMENLINANMDDLLATTLIEYNGMKIDSEFANQKLCEFGEPNYDELAQELPMDLPFVFNWNSNDHISALLFGGDIHYYTREIIGEFKTGTRKGTPKSKLMERIYTFPGLQSQLRGQSTKKDGVFKVDDKVLVSLTSRKGLVARIATKILKERDRAKQINTYYKPMVDLSRIDGLLHAELIHVQTNTGRLSSRNPNIQNWSKGSSSDIKACCVSRWGSEGTIVEIDASQLEIVVQAYLTQDDRMINEIKKGTDFHCLRLATKENMSYEDVYTLCKVTKDPEWDKKRTLTKTFSFQRAYGAGSKAISASTGIAEDDIKELIRAEDQLFPRVKEYNDTNIANVTRNRRIIGDAICGEMGSTTGRKYVFFEEDSPDFLRKKGIMKTFSPTQIKNYPVQGFGAEILAVFRADLARKLIGREDRVVMINTVHDSIIFDCKNNIVDQFKEWLLKESKNVIQLMETQYNLKINVPLEFDIKSGKNWKEIV